MPHWVAEVHDTPVVVTLGDWHTGCLLVGLERDLVAQEGATRGSCNPGLRDTGS